MEEYNELKVADLNEALSDGIKQLGLDISKLAVDLIDVSKICVDLISSVWLVSTPKAIELLVQSMVRDKNDRDKVLELGLVSYKVVKLSYRVDKTGKKNMNRIRKELRLYGKRERPNDFGEGVS